MPETMDDEADDLAGVFQDRLFRGPWEKQSAEKISAHPQVEVIMASAARK